MKAPFVVIFENGLNAKQDRRREDGYDKHSMAGLYTLQGIATGYWEGSQAPIVLTTLHSKQSMI